MEYILCTSCWRVCADNRATSLGRCGNLKCKFSNNAELFMKFRGEIRQMLWSLFPQCRIYENIGIDGAHAGDGEDMIKPLFHFVIPEYRLAIDLELPAQIMPAEIGPEAIEKEIGLRIKFDDCKADKLHELNYRWTNILTNDLNGARNDLLSYINEFYILQQDSGISLLTPKLQGDAGWDIICEEDILCAPQTGTDIPSNLFLEIPNHLYALVQARSSTSQKKMLVLPGVIDPSYRGRIYVMAYNLTDAPIQINKGERIAQLLFFPRIPHLHMQMVDELKPSERGNRGFGSTGK